MANNNTFYDFLSKIKCEWKKLTDVTYFDNEDLKESCKEISADISARDITKRIKLLNCINQNVIQQSKLEMNHHLDKHNLYKQIIDEYEQQ